MASDDWRDEVARSVLACPPAPPVDPGLFSSNTLFGEPGIYPEGPAMVPAQGPGHGDEDLTGAVGALSGTVADAVHRGFPARTSAGRLSYGVPASPGRVVGPPAVPGPPGARVVNERYRGEDPVLLAPSLAHDLLWSPATTGHAAETLLHALAAMVHVQLVAQRPSLAHAGTELARRQNSLAVSLLNSRRPGTSRVTLVAPDGPGTIPGGAPSMQTADFWSIPFASVADEDAPPLAGEVLTQLADPSAVAPGPPRFSEDYGRWLGEHLRSDWLAPLPHLRAAVALGLVTLDQVAERSALDPGAVVAAFGLEAAAAVWR